MLSCICMLSWKYLYITVMALVGFSASAVQALTYQNGDYMGSLNKKASGVCIFLPGAHYLTINSPYGADSSLNKLLLLLLLQVVILPIHIFQILQFL